MIKIAFRLLPSCQQQHTFVSVMKVSVND